MAQPDPLVQRSLLLVDDDLTFQHHGQLVFGRAGWNVITTSSGRQALAHLAAGDFSLLVIDLCLPDMQGTDVLRQIAPGRLPPFFLISGFLDTKSTVEAARLGAVDVLDKPIDIFELLERATEVVAASLRQTTRLAAAVACPQSAAERWAHYVMLASDCPHDLPTLQAWAAFVNISYSGLRECCRLAGIPAQESRDFARMLRAIRHSMRVGCLPSLLLDVSDHRTLAGLLDRAGLPCGGAMVSPLQAFMANQRLVAEASLALRVLRGHLARLH